MNSDSDNVHVVKLKRLLEQDLSRSGKDFQFIQEDKMLKEMSRILIQAYKILDKTIDNHPFEINLERFSDAVLKLGNKIQSFTPSRNDTGESIRQDILSHYRQLFNSTGEASPILGMYFLSELRNSSKNSIADFKSDLNKELDRLSTLKKEIEDEAREKVTEDYSSFFLNEAVRLSRFGRTDGKFKGIGLGTAQRFFLLGTIFLVTLVILVLNGFLIPDINEIAESFEKIKMIDDQATYLQFIIPFLTKKLILALILIFGVRFSFRQYSINKHLATLNKHRSNALKSYNLLSKQLGDESPEKDRLIVEIAKTIYDSKETGFMKTDERDSISILDKVFLSKE